jgi:hypothetical protein
VADCDWEIPERAKPDGDVVPVHPCGGKAYVVFSRKVRHTGILEREAYTRCRRHAPPATIDLAKEQGYTVTLEEEA